MAEKKQPKQALAPYQIDPTTSFEKVASLRYQIKLAQKESQHANSLALEKRNGLKKLQSELDSLIDGESDPTPNLFSGLIKPTNPTAGDIAKEPIAALGLSKKDTECLAGNGITTVGELNAARLKEGGMDAKKYGKAFLGRLDKKLQAFMTARHMGQQAKPTEQPAADPKRDAKKPKAKRGRPKKAAEPAAAESPAA